MTVRVATSTPVWNKGRFVIGACGLLLAAIYLWDASSLSMGSLSEPGPQFFPLAVGVAFAASSIAVMLEAPRLRRPGPDAELPRGVQRRNMLIIAGSLVAFALALPLLGFSVTCFVFCAITLRTIGAPSWRLLLLASLILTGAVYVVFDAVLDVPLPTLL